MKIKELIPELQKLNTEMEIRVAYAHRIEYYKTPETLEIETMCKDEDGTVTD